MNKAAGYKRSPPNHLTEKQKKFWRRNMGYRSDVIIAVAFKDNAHRDEVWAVYCMDPRVQKHDLTGAWKNYDKGDYPVLWYQGNCVKWYDSYEDVQGIEHLAEVASNFARERGYHYGSIYYRVGEEMTDMESAERAADPDGSMMSMLYDLCGIKRRVYNNFD